MDAVKMPLYNYRAQVVNVVDGDTVDARLTVARELDIGFHQTYQVRAAFVQRLRLLGVNAPEMTGASRPAGSAAKAFVERELLGRRCVVRSEKGDSFGRWLALVLVDGASFNDRLVAEGFAVPFMV